MEEDRMNKFPLSYTCVHVCVCVVPYYNIIMRAHAALSFDIIFIFIGYILVHLPENSSPFAKWNGNCLWAT